VITNGQQPTWSPNIITLEKKMGLQQAVLYHILLLFIIFVRNNNNNTLLCNITSILFQKRENCDCRSQWPRGLKLGSEAFRLLGFESHRSWKSACFECCVLSVRGPCVGLITRSEES